ncbi:hypothetical protein [Flavobacterium hungaricum]|uniref:Transposase n=1 Tax=Flavobacterium hungaricum TaxID=2082725 RepID=A0ABR9TMW4_9FLAO|nr:hypothetical protein [Flavobacterium hungaricum]MBE8726159.1 hypothetical protein [Flavobacterium hungaricum]
MYKKIEAYKTYREGLRAKKSAALLFRLSENWRSGYQYVLNTFYTKSINSYGADYDCGVYYKEHEKREKE